VDLPTYTSIWRIEKRLYKLYDFRLPMPLPINWIAVFAGITIPYIILLIAIGLPFIHTLVWLYVLPPGVLTWLTTRPVIENKRLPELVESQVRYLAEPRTWVRLTPLSEKDQIVLTARVWRSRPDRRRGPDSAADREPRRLALPSGDRGHAAQPLHPGPVLRPTSVFHPERAAADRTPDQRLAKRQAAPGSRARQGQRPAAPQRLRAQERAGGVQGGPRTTAASRGGAWLPPTLPAARTAAPAVPSGEHEELVPPADQISPTLLAGNPPGRRSGGDDSAHAMPDVTPPPATSVPPAPPVPVPPVLRGRAGGPNAGQLEVSHDGPRRRGEGESGPSPEPAPSTQAGTAAGALKPRQPPQDPPAAAAPAAPEPVPAVEQVGQPGKQALPSIERALSAPGRDMNAPWNGKVKVVTGHGAAQGPGSRDAEAQDRNRARLPLAEPRRILVLGCTSGAGQSVTALMTASMLASLREHPVAAVDLHDGTLARHRSPAAWLEELLAGRPPQVITPTRPDGLHPSPKPSPARLDVIAAHQPLSDGDDIKLAVQLNRHYPLAVIDPGAAGLSRLLNITDQLLVVVPANTDAAGALADTREWLDNNGHADLATQSVTVINGVSRRSLPDVNRAESIARGRSRAIVRVPWDDMLPVAATGPATLRPQTRVAYTALSGVLVAGLTAVPVRKK
jgi:hypothetical protein